MGVRILRFWRKLALMVVLTTAVIASVFIAASYNGLRQTLLHESDQRLQAGAYAVLALLAPDYHQHITGPDSVNAERFLADMAVLSDYADRAGFAYVYTYMYFAGRIVTTASSATPYERRHQTHDHFFQHYASAPPELYASFQDGKTRYLEYQDAYGAFRSIFLPIALDDGHYYVIGVDLELSYLQAKLTTLRNHTLGLGLILFAVSLLLLLGSSRTLIQPLQREERLSGIFDGLDSIVFVCDPQSQQVLFVNAQGQHALGITEHSACTQIILNAKAAHCADCHHQDLTLDQAVQRWEIHNPYTDRWYDCQRKCISWNDGRCVYLQIAHDITERKQMEQHLEQSEARFRQLFKEMPDAYALHEIICDDQGQPIDYRYIEINPAFEQMTGLRADDLIGRRVLEVLPNTEDHWIETFGRVALSGEPMRIENYSQELDKFFEVHAYRPAPGKFVVVFADTTQRKRAEQTLQNSEQHFRALFTDLPVPILICEVETADIIDANHAAIATYGCANLQELRQRAIWFSKPPYSRADALRWNQKALSEGLQVFEWYIEHSNGQNAWVMLYLNAAIIYGQQRMLLIQLDITERKHMEAELQRLSSIDALTGLLNRGHFFTLAEREYQRFSRHKRPLSLLMMDIDHFKPINDTHGHVVGDHVLRAVANTLQSNLRQTDLLGRYGGEEFIMLLPDTSGEMALILAERLRQAIYALQIQTPNATLSVTLSLGLAILHPENPVTLDELIDQADRALYHAKQSGRNRTICAP